MIDCTNQNIWYKKRNRFKFKRFLVFMTAFILIISLYLYYKNIVCGRIFDICNSYAQSYCAEALNQSIMQSTKENLNYGEITTIEKNSQGEIVLINLNSQKINTISSELVSNTFKILKEKFSNGIKIPILLFSGIDILSGYGTLVNLKTINVINVNCDFKSEFKSVGINQTLHSIYVIINCDVKIEVPFNKMQNTVETKALISETVIIGKVPEIYFNN